MPSVSLIGFIRVPPADLPAVQAELPRHIELTRAEAGCLRFEVTPAADDPNRFEVSEKFIDAEAFRAHQQRVRSSKWGAVAVNVERHYTIRGLNDA